MLQSERATVALSTSPLDQLVRLGAFGTVVGSYGYHLTFNYLPGGFRLGWAGILFSLQLSFAIVALMARPQRWNVTFLTCGLLASICWIVSQSLGFQSGLRQPDFSGTIKAWLLFIELIWIFSFPETMPVRTIAILAMLSLLWAAVWAAVGPPTPFGGELRPAIVTGMLPEEVRAIAAAGVKSVMNPGMHSAGFFVLLNYMLVDQLRRRGIIPGWMGWPLLAIGLVTLLAYKTRTQMAMLAVYHVGVWYYSTRENEAVRSLPYVMFGLGIVGLALFLTHTSEDVGSLGSGRVATWIDRLHRIYDRDLGPLIFGTGIGSDYFRGGLWWWAKAPAHNDFINAFVEEGVIGVVNRVLLVITLLLRLPGSAKALFWSMITASLLSNGLINDAPMAFYMFLAMAIGIVLPDQSVRPLPRHQGVPATP